MSYDIIEKLKKDIAGFKGESEFEKIGIVTEAGDGIAKISGLGSALSQEVLLIATNEGDIPAVATNLEESSIGAIILGEASRVRVGDRVRQTGRILSLRAGEEMFGRVVDPLGVAIDGHGAIWSDETSGKEYPLERNAPGVLHRESVNVPLHTGIAAIDAMIPIGRGQRELIIGDRQTGKTAIAIDAIINQQYDTGRAPVTCIYVAIGQKQSKIASLIKTLKDANALDYTIIVAAPASSPASLKYLAPYAGCAIGEYFMDKGRDVLIIYDDLSKHADSYRELSLLLRRPPGREAYPGDIFYLHSRLLERSARLSKEHGGGSITALPIIETKLGDGSAYIPTNVISITDGQIYLEAGLFHRGIRPAINVGLSVSRVGSAAQTKAMKKIAGTLRLELAQFRELQAFVQFASDLDEATKKKIHRGELLTDILKQSDGSPEPIEHHVVVLFAAVRGFLDDVLPARRSEFKAGLVDFLRGMHNETVLAPLKTRGELTAEVEEELKKAIATFKATRNFSKEKESE
jgi:F-type H+-transporting ATPase subunit alpha